jgi:4-hydroxy-3-polyprenylbenzoate decarboxylase
LFTLENTPFDSLDFASEQLGLGGRLAIDATTKIGPEKNHEWGKPLSRPADLEQRVSERWSELGLDDLGDGEADPSLFGYALDRLIQGMKLGQ